MVMARIVFNLLSIAILSLLVHPSGSASAAEPVKIVAFGDSLTAGYGLKSADAFPVKLEQALRAEGHDVRVINAGVSGDTTGAGLARFDWAIPQDADAVILELGANDALRGQDPKQTRVNLNQILSKLQDRDVDVLVAGMAAPRSMGGEYVAAFDPIFEDLAKNYNQLYYPFFLDGVALDPKLNQADGLHPNAAGIDEIVKRILPTVEALIKRVESRLAQQAG